MDGKIERHYELAILGGGIAGLGAAHEAAKRGYRAVVLERGAFCGATSSNSLRIIHGGFRYLQSLNFPRVLQSMQDQLELCRWAPHLVKPIKCVLTLDRFGLKSPLPVALAAWLYGGLKRLRPGLAGENRVISAAEVAKEIPLLAGAAPNGALLWTDALLNDLHKFHDFICGRLTALGVQLVDQCAVTAVRRQPEDFVVECRRGGEPHNISARYVINTLGPWINSLEKQGLVPGRTPFWCKAYNLVIKKQLDAQYILGRASSKGRLFFAVPRGSASALGTWYVPLKEPLAEAAVHKDDLVDFVAALNQTFPKAALNFSEIEHVDLGVLPCHSNHAEPKLLGSEVITADRGYVEVLSTKYTTFLSQGRKAVQALKV
ncbi:MAG: FAD-dependent oxidoreductase [Oligoflexia bacterium]|nr:FAD-dependent oxidoreductase [Oligoflexia bacterium]